MIHAKGPRCPVTEANEYGHALLTSKHTVAWSMAKKVRIVEWIALNGLLCGDEPRWIGNSLSL